MICKTCGRVLSDADSFCPTCGATVESQPEQKEVVFHAPQRDFEWDVHSFPGDAPKPTEDTNFDWGISANEFRRRPEQPQPQPQQTVAAQQPAQGQWQTFQQPQQVAQQPQAQQAPQQPVQQVANQQPAAPQAPQFEQQAQQPAQQAAPQQPMNPQQPVQPEEPQVQQAAQPAQQQMNPQQPMQQAEPQVQQAAQSQQAQPVQPQAPQQEQQDQAPVQPEVMQAPVQEQAQPQAPEAVQPQAPAEEESKKSKGGFFARFKDRKMTVEQPVITDEMIAEAQREKLEAQKQELRAAAAAEQANMQQAQAAAEQAANQQFAEQPAAEPQVDMQQAQAAVQPEAMQPQVAVQPTAEQVPEQPASPTKKEHVEFDWNQPAPSAAPAQPVQAQTEPQQTAQAQTEPQQQAQAQAEQQQQAQPTQTEQPAAQPTQAEAAPEQQPAPEQPAAQQDEQKPQQVKSSSVPEAVFTQNELKADRPSDITGEALERELFGGAAVTGMVDGGEGLSRQTARIDQFYTFNRKNEEFQKLLDDEYDKFRAGKPFDNSTFAANVEAIKEKDLERMIPRVDGPEVAFDNRQTSVFKPISDEPVAVDEDYEDPDKKAAAAAMAIASSPIIADEEKIREMFGTSKGDKAAGKPAEELTEEEAKQKAKEEAAEQKRLKKEAKEKAKREKREQKARAKAEKVKAGKASGSAAQTGDAAQTGAAAQADAAQAGGAAQSGLSATDAAAADAALAGLGAAGAAIAGTAQSGTAGTAQSGTAGTAQSGTADAAQAGAEGIGAADAAGAAATPADEAAQKAAKKEEQQSKIGKIIIIILSVILALLVIALGLKIIAPDSILSQKIDNIADSVMTVFTGDEEEQEPASVDDESREDFNSDLTGVIQESVDDNFNNLIAQVSYDPELTYEKKKNKYKDKDLKDSVPITNNVWYEQEDGKKLYLDEAIVKNVVRFESQWQSMIREGREAVLSLVDEDTKLYDEVDNSFESNPTSEFKQLDIGEIRRGRNNNYYVWVRETKDDGVKEKVYKIFDDQRNMQFVAYTQL